MSILVRQTNFFKKQKINKLEITHLSWPGDIGLRSECVLRKVSGLILSNTNLSGLI